jgi:hypothetical protein
MNERLKVNVGNGILYAEIWEKKRNEERIYISRLTK